jgi:hypothetical protein
VRGERPTLEDFKSARALGKPLRDARYEREWSGSVSVYDELAHAVRKARGYGGKLGAYIATMNIQLDSPVTYRQTTADVHHFSVFGEPAELLALVRGEVIPIWSEQ